MVGRPNGAAYLLQSESALSLCQEALLGPWVPPAEPPFSLGQLSHTLVT